ncbi:hypothetical protein N7470_000483 [Penicillium chermesinum]|nr:hypothetical protein N7470_000483 [Penicillium chermesinum]
MAVQSLSAAGGVTTPQPRQSSTRTVAQRRVYGKRKNNAPRSVFEDKSPARDSICPPVINDTVEAIQTKLAEIAISNDPVPNEQDPGGKVYNETNKGGGTVGTIPDVQDKCAVSASTSQQHEYLSTKATELSMEPEPTKQYETMLEVRICSQPKNPSPVKGEPAPSVQRTARKRIPAARRSSGIIHDSKANAYVRPILNEALSPIASQGIQKFGTWASRSANMFHVAKLAEGSYGEVYKLHLREAENRPVVSKSKLAKLKAYGDGVFKVVPLRAQSGPGSKKFTTIDEIAAEVKMLKYLDPIPGFARFREIHVVQGRFPPAFQHAWDHYKETKDDCLNPNPASKKAYPDTQLWAIIEMDDAGCELEKFPWCSIFQIYDIFWGVAMSLARAEEYSMFEHRDLHLGNVCIRSTKPDGCMNPPTDLEIARRSSSSGFGFSSLETTIIDYSLSRANLLLGDLPENSEGYARHCLHWHSHTNGEDSRRSWDLGGIRTSNELSMASLYPQEPTQKPQARTLAATTTDNAQSSCPCSPNKSMERVPTLGKSNKAKYSGEAGTLMKERQTKDLQAHVAGLRQTLEDRLKAVLELLDLEHGHEDMCCAADLVAYAMDSQWLAEEDFFNA